MYPVSVSFLGLSVNSFGVMLALAFLAAYLAVSRELRRKGAPEGFAADMFVWVVVCSISGAKLFFAVENFTFSQIVADPLGALFSRGGLTFYGGLGGGIAAGIFRARKNGFGILKTLDATAPALAIAYAVGRVGCLLIGDDYGTASSLPWAIAFPEGSPPVDHTVHPTQIYETVLMTGVFAVLWRRRKAERADGRLFALYLVLAGLERFFVEFLRTTTQSPIDGLSVAQVISAVMIIAGVARLMRRP